jgi:hypothetical protein
MKTINIAHALHSLAPGAVWKYNDEDYSTIEWISEDIEMPTQAQVESEMLRLQQEYDLEQEGIANEQAAKELAKQSALEKLAMFGITQEEAKALFGL